MKLSTMLTGIGMGLSAVACVLSNMSYFKRVKEHNDQGIDLEEPVMDLVDDEEMQEVIEELNEDEEE